ncbi:MAG: type I DNA topoisomerase [Candidatus Neomarinimicrobiota bacterium]
MAERSLIVVESPSKARTINRYLGKEYRVLACNGHIKDLPEHELGVDITDNFKATYVLLPKKARIIKDIREKARSAPAILIATDPDREGEAIAWHLATELNGRSNKIKRVLFTEITPSGIKEGIENLRGVDMNLVDAQQARRIIDRIVGFRVSQFLWTVLFDGLSAGRVQSVALRLVCERHKEIVDFEPVEYWTLDVDLKTKSDEVFTAQLYRVEGEKPDISTGEETGKIQEALEDASFQVSSIERKKIKKNPFPPFITSTLQQDASVRLKLSPTRTMRIAQKLYEGVDIGKGEPIGLITYMRTDSTRLSDQAVKACREVISKEFGSNYLPAGPRIYKQKKKTVQGAHEAIRPTDPSLMPENLTDRLEKDELKLYRLIWQRFVACQMAPAVLDQTTIVVSANSSHLFRTTGSTTTFDGYRKVYPVSKKKDELEMPQEIEEGEQLEKLAFKPEQHFTKPPPSFTDSSLIKELDSLGIGRPSTFAETVSRLFKREYVKQEKGKLIPTETGLMVSQILTTNLPDIFDVGFTAKMEEELDEIETGKQDYLEVLNDFYRPFQASMEAVSGRKKEIKDSLREKTDEVCEVCGSPMVSKWNRRGQKFLGCSTFPECRNTKSLTTEEEKEPEILEGKVCPECGSRLLIKTGRFGRYVGCENYPTCKHTESLTTGVMCPKTGCGGEIVERTSRKKKKTFFGCSRYPECDYVSWYRPVLHHCHECGNHFVEERMTKKGDAYFLCPHCKTRYNSLSEEKESPYQERMDVE